MRVLPPVLAAALAGGVTTLARCWRITRTDGLIVGLTEHDEDLTLDGTLFRALGGVSGSETASSLGFAVDGGELSAAFSSDVLDEADLDAGRFDGAQVVEAASLLTAAGLGGYAGGWFTQGRLVFASGANAGFATEVKSHRVDGGVVRIELWQRPPETVAAGDTFVVTAGCDKRFETCRDRFANTLNFRGFPHMPGNDAVLAVSVPGG